MGSAYVVIEQPDVTACDLKRRGAVAEDSLEAERVAAVDEVAPGGRVAVHLPRMVGRVERRVSDEETAASIDNGCDTSTTPK